MSRNMIEHGFYALSVKENLVISHFFGAWNVERTEKYADHVIEVATMLKDKPWARIVDLSSWEGGGIDVIQPLLTLQQWAEKNNCKHVIFINPPLLPKYMLEKYGDPYHEYKICESLEQAIKWVNSKLMVS